MFVCFVYIIAPTQKLPLAQTVMERGPGTPYGGGAGGKFRKPPARKLSTTPYDRPKINESAGPRSRGWLSKLVSPAHDLISRGASKLMPSFLYNPSSASDDPVENSSDDGNEEAELAANTQVDGVHSSQPEILRSSNEAGPSKTENNMGTDSSYPQLEQDNRKKSSDDSELYKIEQIMKGKLFSRDEINRLKEILNSKLVSDVDMELEKPQLTAEVEGKIDVTLAPEYPMMPAAVEEDVNRNVLRISSPRVESDIQKKVDASPIDIAKAYMGTRASELGPSAYSTMSKSERALYRGDHLQSNPQHLSKPSASGAMVQDQHGYATPLGQRSSFGLQSFPRTPYSRTIYSNSKSRSKLAPLQADNSGLKISSSPFQHSRTPIFGHSRTPIFGQVKSRTDINSEYGTGGAIRRVRSKFAAETPRRGSTLYSVQKGPSQVKESNASKVFFPKDNNMELIGTSGMTNNQPVESVTYGSKEGQLNSSPQSSSMARGILEHLANKPTPNELANELKIASAWKSSPSENNDVMQNEVTSSTHLGGIFDLQKNTNGFKFSVEGSDVGKNFTSREKSQESDALNAITMKSKVNGGSDVASHTRAEPSFGITKVSDFQMKSTQNAFMDAKGQDQNAKSWPFQKQVNGQDVMTTATRAAGSELLNKQPSHFSGMKPTLKSISVDKHGGPGFTFQVSSPSNILSEPPTPSIFPSFSSGGIPQASENSALPSFSFGTTSTRPRYDFSSFPSTSNNSTQNMASDIKYSFGSDRNSRVSFKLIGNDSICYS